MAGCFRSLLSTLSGSSWSRQTSGELRIPNSGESGYGHSRVTFTRLRFMLVLLFPLLFSLSAKADEPPAQILAHYMPWFTADTPKWGYHWTMNHFDPEKVGEDGRREIASRDYPEIGPYDSGDPHVLEYHALLMKFSGIDGVIIDWYGTRDFRDYPMIDRNTRALIPWLKKAQLTFTVCYEDQTIKHMIAEGAIKATDDVAEMAKEMNKLADEYFGDEAWVKSNGKPLLLTFGPQHFQAESWKQSMQQCKSPPVVFSLPHQQKNFGFAGAFAWPPVHFGGQIAPDQWQNSLRSIYEKYEPNQLIPVVFPSFDDFYAEAKVQNGYGVIESRDGQTFAESLKMARETKSQLIQIATWNDFGEGTTIEPTREYGLRYLEHLIDSDSDAKFAKPDLTLPLQLYRLRKSNAKLADKVAEALFAGDCDLARDLLKQSR